MLAATAFRNAAPRYPEKISVYLPKGARAALERAAAEKGVTPPELVRELCANVGDGVNQAADLISEATSIPSQNFTPAMIFGNWFCPFTAILNGSPGARVSLSLGF